MVEENYNDLSLEQLRMYKAHLVDEIKQRQKITRELDKHIKKRLIEQSKRY